MDHGIYTDLQEIEEMKERLKVDADEILDAYKNNPKECSRLLKVLNELEEELVDLEKQYNKLLNDEIS
ncbi:MAG: hypothetical protein RL728_473 [Bacteroidota bacterium]|jgi:predicted  nucleic acid-binding Zn-ribbon protein